MTFRRFQCGIVPALVFAAMCAAAAPGRAGEAAVDMTGVWSGTYAAATTPGLEYSATITVKRSGDRYGGVISMPEESLNINIRNGELNGEHFTVSGIMPTRLKDGSMAAIPIAFTGFVYDDGNAWDGNWVITGPDGNPAGGNAFNLTRQGGLPQAVGGSKQTGQPPAKPQPPVVQGPSFEGEWTGIVKGKGDGKGVLKVRRSGDGYAGTLTIDKDEIKDLAITVQGDVATLTGTLKHPSEDINASIAMEGKLAADAWRGTITANDAKTGEPLLAGTFNLQNTSAPVTKPETKIESKPGTKGTDDKPAPGGGIKRYGRIGSAEPASPANPLDATWEGTHTDITTGKQAALRIHGRSEVEFPDANVKAKIGSSQRVNELVSLNASWTEVVDGKQVRREASFNGPVVDNVWDGVFVVTQDGKAVQRGHFSLKKPE